MSGFTKLFASIVGPTIWTEDDRTRIVWITMLALANQHGEVEASIPGLAKFASVPIADAEKALATLSSPDPYSRSKEFEGRRISAIDGGWVILNYAKYRERASADDRRERDRIRQQRNRQTKRVTKTSAPVTPSSAPVTDSHDKQSQSQKSDAEAENRTERTGVSSQAQKRPACVLDVAQLALDKFGFKPDKARKWCMDMDKDGLWLKPAREILESVADDDDVHAALKLAFRFIKFNNGKGWELKKPWRAAFLGFDGRCANYGTNNLPPTSVPRIADERETDIPE